MNGNGVNYRQEGQGPPVILIHGIAASLYDWVNMMPELAAHGYHAYALDLLGHGESHKPADPQEYHVDCLFAHFTSWVDRLGLDNPLWLVGHSLGGYLSLQYALRFPSRVRGLVLIDPFYDIRQLSPWLRLVRRRPYLGARAMQAVPEWLINILLGWDPSSSADFSPLARQQIANDYKRASPHFVYITRDIPALTNSLQQVQVPTLVIWGEHDLTLRPETFERLVEQLPRGSSHPIPECGHQPHIGKPALVNRLVLDFLAGLAGADPGREN
jgi:pimeloyl-ACP methyl ester carboxylesterase